MADRGLIERARRARAAHAEVHAAVSQVARRDDERDPRTRRWLDSLKQHAVAWNDVFPPALSEYVEGRRPVRQLHTDDILDFLDPEIRFFRSGYIKERLLREIGQRRLAPGQALRLQDVVLKLVRQRDCREFRYYCNAAAAVDDGRLRWELDLIERSDNQSAQRRARWMSAALDHARRTKAGRSGS